MSVGMLSTLGREGDVQKFWDTTNEDEVADAERTFNELKAKGYLAYRVTEGGERGETMHRFDPEAGAILMHRQLVGG